MADAERAEAAGAASADELVAEADTGARNPRGWVGRLITGTCIVWSLFQIYIASAIPFWLTQATGLPLVLNSDQTRPIHLAFAIALATMAFPLFKSSPRRSIPWYDWGLLALGVGACLYLVVFKAQIGDRPGLPITADLVASTIGIAVLMIAVFRSLGLPLLCVAGVFLLYTFFGHSEWLPEVMRWKGASYSKAMWHYWMQTEGVFGVALGVSTSMIFLFVLFGALLEKSGGGNWFIKVAIALLGSLRGGPAKASVLSSASTGMISGSSIANTVTTGTFTIPLMKRVGFPAEKAGAVEVASSTNGQLTPPVMGAAAFLMIEYVGVSYIEVIKHAFLPAVISYIALLYIVHLEALKLGLEGLQKEGRKLGFLLIMLLIFTGIGAAAIVAFLMHYLLGFIYAGFGDQAFLVSALMLIAIYLGLIVVAARQPDLVVDDARAPIMVAPRFTPTVLAGLYYLVPIGVLVWCLMYLRLSPGLSAFWATACMLAIAVSHSTLKAIARGAAAKVGGMIALDWHNLVQGLISGARNMIGIGVATGAAGIIVGTISLTGAHQMIGLLIEYIAGDNLMVLLILVAILSLILGMGLPTTANYIVVSSLMAPVIVTVGAQAGLVVPLIAVHMFVFYFGILADDTPPVGLAAYAAAAISRGDPIRTGVQGFMYDIRTALLPFLFIFNTDLLLIGVDLGTTAGLLHGVFIFAVALLAMLLFAGATQGFFVARNKWWETIILLLVAFTLFRPGFWLNMVEEPYVHVGPDRMIEEIAAQPEDAQIRVVVSGPDFDTGIVGETTLAAPLGAVGDGVSRLASADLTVLEEDGLVKLEEPFAGTTYFTKLTDKFDFYGDDPVVLSRIEIDAERMPKQLFFIPALIVLAGLVLIQWRRAEVPPF